MVSERYRSSLRDAVAGAGAIRLHADDLGDGRPHRPQPGPALRHEALLLVAGAVAAFALVGAIAFGGIRHLVGRPGPGRHALWGVLHLPSVAAAIGAVALLNMVDGTAIWAAAGFAGTFIYLIGLAGEYTLSAGMEH